MHADKSIEQRKKNQTGEKKEFESDGFDDATKPSLKAKIWQIEFTKWRCSRKKNQNRFSLHLFGIKFFGKEVYLTSAALLKKITFIYIMSIIWEP